MRDNSVRLAQHDEAERLKRFQYNYQVRVHVPNQAISKQNRASTTQITVCAEGAAFGQPFMLYSPEIVANHFTPATYVFLGAFLLLCITPFALQVFGEVLYMRL